MRESIRSLLASSVVFAFASVPATAKQVHPPSTQDSNAGTCVDEVEDQATGNCIQASSVPTFRLLFPYPGLNNVFTPPQFVGGGESNTASGFQSTVGAGKNNTASGVYATVGGGRDNTAMSGGSNLGCATVGGGAHNTTDGDYATVGGGRSNRAYATDSTVGGGSTNYAGPRSTVGGGFNNTAIGSHAAIAGGTGNRATEFYATVGGGRFNEAGYAATVGGGNLNKAYMSGATVGGGFFNKAEFVATVGGGYGNIASGNIATVGGGIWNAASGDNATVPGGFLNAAEGSYSFAAGRQAKALHTGSFVWGDSLSLDKTSSTGDEFSVYCTGGARFFTNSSATTGVLLAPGAGSWTAVSDRDSKEHLEPVDGRDVLELVVALPISTWNYKAQSDSIRHMGPMAQDFYAAFGLGLGEESIDTIDPDGVALAAIQGLNAVVVEKDAEIAELRERLERLEELALRLEAQVEHR